MRLYLVRHGQTKWNEERIYQGHTDIPLNQYGMSEALLLREKIKSKEIDVCISSPLKRAIQTAAIITENKMNIITDSLLIEQNLGIYEGTKYNINTSIAYSPNNGVESMDHLFIRAEKFLDSIYQNYEDKTVLVVSHGSLIRAIHFQIIGYSEDEDLLKFDVPNCCLLEYDL